MKEQIMQKLGLTESDLDSLLPVETMNNLGLRTLKPNPSGVEIARRIFELLSAPGPCVLTDEEQDWLEEFQAC